MKSNAKSLSLSSKDWSELVEQLKVRPLEPDEMTSERLSKETGKTMDRCANILYALFIEDKLTRRQITFHGARSWAYRLKG